MVDLFQAVRICSSSSDIILKRIIMRNVSGDGSVHVLVDVLLADYAEAATVPVGTVPIYQVAEQLADIVDMRPQRFPGRRRAPGPAGRGLHDDPLPRCCASTCR